MIWYEAAAYCNWLSKEEGIPEDQWCYEIKGQVTKLKANYLSLTGYRLPTEAEMEYATRAGAVTSRYLRGDGGVAAEVCVVRQELARTDLAGGEPEAERSGVIRRAGKCVYMVSGELQGIPSRKGEKPPKTKKTG